MRVVVDANIAVALFVNLQWSEAARSQMGEWTANMVDLWAPMLWQYEVTSAIRKSMVGGLLTPDDAAAALDALWKLRLNMMYPDRDLNRAACDWAGRLNQVAAYDAAYVAVAERLNAELWTADKRLAGACRRAGLEWVYELSW